MKITDVRSMRLSGPRLHSVGGAESTIGKWIVRVDTDAIFGLGEADDFMGVKGRAISGRPASKPRNNSSLAGT